MSKVIDALGRIKEAAQNYFRDDSGVWRPARCDYNGALLAGPAGGFDSSVVWSASGVSSGLPETSVATTTVPSGYLYVIEKVMCFHNDTANRITELRAHTGSSYARIKRNAALAPNDGLHLESQITIAAGGYLLAVCYALADTKTLVIQAWGYQVRLT